MGILIFATLEHRSGIILLTWVMRKITICPWTVWNFKNFFTWMSNKVTLLYAEHRKQHVKLQIMLSVNIFAILQLIITTARYNTVEIQLKSSQFELRSAYGIEKELLTSLSWLHNRFGIRRNTQLTLCTILISLTGFKAGHLKV